MKYLFFVALFLFSEVTFASKSGEPPERRIAIRKATKISTRPTSGLIQTEEGLALNLSETKTDDAAFILEFSKIADAQKLQGLDLSHTFISSRSFHIINQFNCLSNLKLRAVNLYTHELGLLTDLRSLTYLDLSECQTLSGNLALTIRNYLGHLPIASLKLRNLMDTCPLHLDLFEPSNNGKVFSKLKNLDVSGSFLNEECIVGLPLEKLYARGVHLKRYGTHKVAKRVELNLSRQLSEQEQTYNFHHEGAVRRFIFLQYNYTTKKFDTDPNTTYTLEIINDYTRPTYWYCMIISTGKLASFRLTALDLSANQLGDDAVAFMKFPHSLQALHLDDNPITQRCLQSLVNLPFVELSLRKTFVADYQDDQDDRKPLQLKFPKTLRRLYLDGSLIEGHSLETIFTLPDLHTLSLVDLPLTDQGVEKVFTCPRFINIKISTALLEREQALRKKKGVHWSSAAKFIFK